jgi:hypothetical protein
VTLVAYLSHPIGPQDRYEAMEEHHDNLEHAHSWFKFLVAHTRWAILAPWLAYLAAVGQDLYGPRALTDQVTLLGRCDLLVQVGGWISPHMTIEQNHAKRMGIRVVNLADLGVTPIQDVFISSEVRKRTIDLDKNVPRRAWMPPLDEADVDVLRKAQVALHNEPNTEDARALIQRIVTAAMRR